MRTEVSVKLNANLMRIRSRKRLKQYIGHRKSVRVPLYGALTGQSTTTQCSSKVVVLHDVRPIIRTMSRLRQKTVRCLVLLLSSYLSEASNSENQSASLLCLLAFSTHRNPFASPLVCTQAVPRYPPSFFKLESVPFTTA